MCCLLHKHRCCSSKPARMVQPRPRTFPSKSSAIWRAQIGGLAVVAAATPMQAKSAANVGSGKMRAERPIEEREGGQRVRNSSERQPDSTLHQRVEGGSLNRDDAGKGDVV